MNNTDAKVPTPDPMSRATPDSGNPLDSLEGEELGSVVFVRDYLQLDFDGTRVTCKIWPTIVAPTGAINVDDQGYRDALCKLISTRIESVEETSERIALVFSDGRRLELDLAAATGRDGDRVIIKTRDDEWGWW
jgi:hypothetical protein